MSKSVKIDLDRAAELLGYESIRWDADNDCFSGYGSSDAFDRSNDGSEGRFVADSEDALRDLIRRAE